MKLTESTFPDTERVLIIGLPGTGKSTLAAGLAEEFNLIWIDIENGSSLLKNLPLAWKERIDLIKLPDSASFPVACETLLQLFKKSSGTICHLHGKYECALCKKEGKSFDSVDFTKLTERDIVVVDSATQLSNSILAHIMKDLPVTAKPERDHWGSTRKHTEYMASQFQGAQFNLVVICHAVEAELEDGKKKLVPQFGSAGMSASFAKNFDHVIYCDVVNKKHKAYSSSSYSSGVVTKSRGGFEIEKLPEPSLLPLFRKEVKERKVESVDTINPASSAIQPSINKSVGLSAVSPGAQALANLKAGVKK